MLIPKSDYLNVLMERGLLYQCTNLEALDQKLTNNKITAYIGFDCTSNSLHIGSLLQIIMLRWLRKTGNEPIVLIGGGTSKIGDPSFKLDARKLLSEKEVYNNKSNIKNILDKCLSLGEVSHDVLMVDNIEWLNKLEYIKFLRDYGAHISVNQMLGFESVKLRLDREYSLSFLEFSYSILQAYDFLELHRRYDCVLQMGGSDQWANIVHGVRLIRRVDNNKVYGLTSPLISSSSGVKMGKTTKGAVWLNEDRLSVYNFWQYWRNTKDIDVIRFLKLFTEIPLDEVSRLAVLGGTEINEAKKILANEVTQLCHGKAAASAAAEISQRTFDFGGISEGLPKVDIDRRKVEAGLSAVNAIVYVGLASSKSAARRLIRDGGVRVNNSTILNESVVIAGKEINDAGFVKISIGKKRHALLRVI
ncbi:tyrosine--tRNA ligase [Candidatus Endolissoclinum faulkneri]|uniref:tyrosine--tRNA ligase n=1 Tax=Candidatus Endolissoclinum faulkneri TaxID=1263979 RepID=UPI0002D2DC5D|nr:tyrosine--tRNA ligase [Candidatus Endolissoclinum faulkneri]